MYPCYKIYETYTVNLQYNYIETETFYPGPEVEASKRDLPHALTPMPSDPRPFCLPEIFLNLYMLKNVDRNLCYLRHLHICLLTRICICIPEINAVFRNLL